MSQAILRSSRLAVRLHLARPAFTLIEMLVALTLCGLLACLIGGIAVQVVAVRERVATEVERIRRDTGVSADLAVLLTPDRKDRTPLTLTGFDRPRLTLWCLASFDPGGMSLHLPRRPATVTYELVGSSQGGSGLAWVRTVVDETDPGQRSSETVASSLAALTLQVFDGQEWYRQFPHSSGKSGPPLQVSMQWQWMGEATPQTRTMTVRVQQ